MSKTPSRIGFIGQGYVGKNYADDFERRGYKVVRYSLEESYRANKEKIKDADIVFICVPTPTTPKGFDVSVVAQGLSLVGNGKITVIKSTLLPGTTRKLQKKFPHLTILFSPEFLNANTAAHIIGLPVRTKKHQTAAVLLHTLLPQAPFELTCTSEEAEIYKYAHNLSGYMQVLTYNLMYDTVHHMDADWAMIRKALAADPMVPNWYIEPVHKSGRGAGGACFIKDMAAFAQLYQKLIRRPEGVALLKAAQKNNIALLVETKKDLNLLLEVYGPRVGKK
jgi:UDPglucose 6-dehydrogenase